MNQAGSIETNVLFLCKVYYVIAYPDLYVSHFYVTVLSYRRIFDFHIGEQQPFRFSSDRFLSVMLEKSEKIAYNKGDILRLCNPTIVG